MEQDLALSGESFHKDITDGTNNEHKNLILYKWAVFHKWRHMTSPCGPSPLASPNFKRSVYGKLHSLILRDYDITAGGSPPNVTMTHCVKKKMCERPLTY